MISCRDAIFRACRSFYDTMYESANSIDARQAEALKKSRILKLTTGANQHFKWPLHIPVSQINLVKCLGCQVILALGEAVRLSLLIDGGQKIDFYQRLPFCMIGLSIASIFLIHIINMKFCDKIENQFQEVIGESAQVLPRLDFEEIFRHVQYLL